MALITCPECGNQISDRAPSCPNCGILKEDIHKLLKQNDSKTNENLKEKPEKTEEITDYVLVESKEAYFDGMIRCLCCSEEYGVDLNYKCPRCGYSNLTLDSKEPSKESIFANCYINAEQGNAVAQYMLAEFYYYGKGVVQDPEEAVKWYQKAAEQGDKDAIKNLKKLTRYRFFGF